MKKQKNDTEKDTIETSTEAMQLRCKLTQDEILAAGQKMADHLNQINEKESELKSISDRYKGEIKALNATLGVTSEKIRTGFEIRNVDVETSKDFANGFVTQKRLDTGEVFSSRKMLQEESQQQMKVIVQQATQPANVEDKQVPQTQETVPPVVKDLPTEKQINKAWQVITENNRATSTIINRKMKVKAELAQRILEALEERGIVSVPQGPDNVRDILKPYVEVTEDPPTQPDTPEVF